jgi:hypothetical protein
MLSCQRNFFLVSPAKHIFRRIRFTKGFWGTSLRRVMFSNSSAGSCSVRFGKHFFDFWRFWPWCSLRLCFQPPDFHLVDVLVVLSSPVQSSFGSGSCWGCCWLLVFLQQLEATFFCHCVPMCLKHIYTRPGKLRKSYWTWWFSLWIYPAFLNGGSFQLDM